MIEAARQARRPNRQSRDARFAQAMRGTPRLELQTLGGRPLRARRAPRRRRPQQAQAGACLVAPAPRLDPRGWASCWALGLATGECTASGRAIVRRLVIESRRSRLVRLNGAA